MGNQVTPQPPQPDAILAAIADLAPVVVPGAAIDAAGHRLVVALPDNRRASVALDGVVDACRAVDHTRWPRLIADWLGDVVDRLGGSSGGTTTDDLRVRLVPTPDADIDGVITQQYGPHFQLQLMADLPDRRSWVTEAGARALGLSSGGELEWQVVEVADLKTGRAGITSRWQREVDGRLSPTATREIRPNVAGGPTPG